MRHLANWTGLALIALSSCALAGGGVAHAQEPVPGAVPPGWVWQGVWQNGQWQGQWIPGPGGAPGAPMPGTYPPPPSGAQWGGDPGAMRMAERCRDSRHDGEGDDGHARHMHHRDCEAFFHAHPEFAQGYPGPTPYGPPAYGPAPYGPMAYPPVGFMMVPVMTAPQQPCVETKTVTTTTTYITERRRHVTWARPHRKEKRVYTGS
jgi:hypothetical protein